MTRPTGVIIFLVFVFAGCQSHPPPPQPAVVKNQIERYLKAKSQNSCDEFGKLARDESFSLAPLAKLRAEEACLKGPIDYASYVSWLRNAALDAAIRSAQQRNAYEELASAAIEKSKQPLTPEEKLAWATTAKEAADKANDQNLADVAQERIYTISPSQKPDPIEKDFLSVADDSRYHRDFKKAEQFYRRIISSHETSIGEKISAYRGLRMSYKNARDHKSYLGTNAQLVRFLENNLKRHKRDKLLLRQLNDAMVAQARAFWTHGHVTDAAKVIRRAEKKLHGRWPLTEIYWLEARMAEERNDLSASNRYLGRALAEITKDSDTKDKLRWQMAWNERRDKNLPASETLLRQLMAETLNEGTNHRAAFWLGKVLKEMHQAESANQVWEKLTQDDPLGYYGLLAYYQLGKPILQSPVTPTPTSTPSPVAQAPMLRPEIADALVQVDEPDVLQSYLDDVAKSYKKDKIETDVAWIELLKYYAHAGLFIKLYENLNLISADQRNVILHYNPELLFPRPFEDQVRQAAQELNVEPELIYSIMRQESAFNPKSRSGADAFGLMQVLPELATTLSKKYSIPFERNEDLYDPTLNIRMGAALIREQLEKYHDQFILAVASYNANDHAIQSWVSVRFRGDALEFIEDIPYEETRGYVRLVMRNLIFYRMLASKGPSMAFPQWVLKMTAAK